MEKLERILNGLEKEYRENIERTIEFIRNGQSGSYKIKELSTRLKIPEDRM